MSGKKYLILKEDNPRTVPLTHVVVDNCGVDLCVPAKPGETLDVILNRICSKVGNGGNGNFELNVDDTNTINTVFNTSTNTLKSNLLVGPLDASVTTLLNWNGTSVKRINISDVGDILIDNPTFITNLFDGISPLFVDTDSIDFSYNSTLHQLSANVKISSSPDNAATILSDGIYVYNGNIYTDEKAQDAVFSTLLGINAITGAYDDSHDNFLLKWGGRLTENTTVFSNLNDFFNVTFTNLGQFNIDAKNITLSSTETPSNKLVIGSVFSSLETTDGHVTIGNNDIELHAFSGLVRSNSPLYLDVVAHTGSTNKVLVHDTNNVVSYRTIPEIIFDFGGVGVTSVGLSMPSAFTVDNSPVTSTGTLAVTGAGTIDDYIDGTGALRPFPELYNDEKAQDAVFNAFVVDNGLTSTYNDAGNSYNIQWGGILLHNTGFDTDYYKATFYGRTVQDYPYTFDQYQSFQNSTGIISFVNTDANVDGSTRVKLGINYTASVNRQEDPDNPTITFIPGYFGDRSGYWMGTNGVGEIANPDGKLYNEDRAAKTVGLFFHTYDHDYTDAVSIYGLEKDPLNLSGVGSAYQKLADRKITTFHTNKDVQLWGYTTSRNDGGTAHALYVDVNGIVKHGPITPLYTDTMAIDAVGTLFTDTSSIDFIFDSGTPSISAQVKVQFLYDTLRRTKIRFRIDDEDAPIAGSSSFTLVNCVGDNVTGKDITFFRERALQFPPDDYTYDITTGLISVTEPFETGERIEIWIDATEMWTVCSSTSPVGADSVLINSTDHLMINGSDKLLI